LDTIVPNFVEPLTYSVDELIICVTIVCAVSVPRTVKLSAEDAVNATDAVPKREPVIPALTLREPVICELLRAITPFLAINSFGIRVLF
jgi:hypothetical protein